MRNDTEDLSGKTGYTLDGSVGKGSFKSVSFWSSMHYTG